MCEFARLHCVCIYLVCVCLLCVCLFGVFLYVLLCVSVLYPWIWYVCVCFAFSVYSSPQGYNTTTVDKPRMLRATITSSPSDSNHPVQHQSQQPRPNQQQVIKQQHQPSLSQKPVYQPSLSPTPIYRRLTTWQHKDNTNTDNTIKTNSPHSNRIKR